MSRSSMCFNTISLHNLTEILIPLTLNFALNTNQYDHTCAEEKIIFEGLIWCQLAVQVFFGVGHMFMIFCGTLNHDH